VGSSSASRERKKRKKEADREFFCDATSRESQGVKWGVGGRVGEPRKGGQRGLEVLSLRQTVAVEHSRTDRKGRVTKKKKPTRTTRGGVKASRRRQQGGGSDLEIVDLNECRYPIPPPFAEKNGGLVAWRVASVHPLTTTCSSGSRETKIPPHHVKQGVPVINREPSFVI